MKKTNKEIKNKNLKLQKKNCIKIIENTKQFIVNKNTKIKKEIIKYLERKSLK